MTKRLLSTIFKLYVDEIHKIAASATNYELSEVSVFARANEITVNAAPIEIYIYATFGDQTKDDLRNMLCNFKTSVETMKIELRIEEDFNLSIVKMNWQFELGV